MLHSVWSGGGSAAGRRRSLLALGALLALIASALIWVAPTQAQNLNPPVAFATVVVIGDDGTANAGRGSLDASDSFDPGDQDVEGKGIDVFQWEVVTESYSWLSLDSYDTAVTYFDIPSADLAARYGQTIEFRVTVTDGDDPPAPDSETVTFNVNQRPTADIAVSAYLEDEDSDEEGTDRYTIDAVIDGPGENGNAANEWDIMESALLVLDGSGSSDPDPDPDEELEYSWALIYPSITTDNDIGLQQTGTEEQLSTDDPDTTGNDDNNGVETIENITADESPYYAYYTLTVTDGDGVTSISVVKLGIHDQPVAPEVKLAETDPVVVAEGDPAIQEVLLPLPTPRYVVNPGVTVTVATEVTDADAVDSNDDGNIIGDETTITDYEWSTGEAPDDDVSTLDVDESKTTRTVEVPDDAEDDTTITVTLTVTDSSGLTGEASVDLLVVEGNTVPVVNIVFDTNDSTHPGLPSQVDPNVLIQFGIFYPIWSYFTYDGLEGGDTDAEGNPTGRVTLRAYGFDPDQPDNTLLTTWVQIDEEAEDLVDPDTYSGTILDLEYPEPGAVSFEVPELGVPGITSETISLSYSALDEHGVGGVIIVRVQVYGYNSEPSADAGDDQIVQPESFVRLNGGRSSANDKDQSIATYSWEITGVATSPDTDEVPVSVQEQVFDELIPTFIQPLSNSEAFVGYNSFPLKASDTRFPNFTTPKVPDGISDIRITVTLTVTDEGTLTDTDEVTITVTNGFFSGIVTGPNFCSNASLGGPTTYAFDSDGDGAADVCSLQTTRRATVARQNALETLAALGATFDVTDGNDPPRTSSAAFADLVIGREGSDLVIGGTPEVSAVDGTCSAPGLDELGDSEADLAADACSTGRVSDPPPPVDPTVAGEFFSGVITGPNFCTNLSLGGPRTYAFDSDDDGVADVCSLPYTRREAVARQNALEMFAAHSQYSSALAAACTALGSTDFGDGEDDLAADGCVVPPDAVVLGDPLPTSTA